MASNKTKSSANAKGSGKASHEDSTKKADKVTKASSDRSQKPAKASKDKSKDKKGSDKNKKPGFGAKARNYFSGVRTEVKRVVWPTRPELVKYSVAVIVMLIFFGVLIYLVDTAIVPLLVLFSGLRG